MVKKISIFLTVLFLSSCTLSYDKIKKGDIHIDDIAGIIKDAIDFFMGIAGTVAVIFIIVGAYKIVFGSLTQTGQEGKNTIIWAITGFVIAALSWLIIKIIIDNFI